MQTQNILRTIPGPKGHFLTGNLPEIQRNRLTFLLELRQDYGDIVRLRLGPAQAVMVFHPQDVQHVLQDNHIAYSKDTRVFNLLKPALGNGLLVSSGAESSAGGDFWLRQRRLMQPAFHRQQINHFGELFSRETLAMLEGWAATIQNGQPFDLQQEMMRLTLSIVSQALFGSKVEDPGGVIGSSITFLLGDLIYRFDHPFYPSLWLPTPRNRHFIQARAELDRVIYALIEGRRNSIVEHHDLLAMLMQARDETTGQPGMNDQQLRDELITLFIAGHETTAVALSWTFYLLSQHPAVESRLCQELNSVLDSRAPTIADLPALGYTRQVLEESLRLYPPAWVTERMATQADEIGGHPIPAGTTLVVSQYVTHRHPDFWPDPEAFDPERFSPEQTASRPRYAYFPFGGGPRQCIGNTFALVEAQLILATILQRFRLELAPGWKVEPEPLITLRPRGGIWMLIEEADCR
jgi:cytochrome P450